MSERQQHPGRRRQTSHVRAWTGRLLASPLRNLIIGGLFVLFICLLATIGYVSAGWSLGDAVYMVVLTIYTVGYDEVRAIHTPFLRANTMMLIILGCTGMIFLTGALVQFITITQFQQLFGTRRMKNDIDSLTDHVIICGFGRIGTMLAQELTAGQAPFVILERSDRRFAEARDLGYLRAAGRCRQRLHHAERAQPERFARDHRPRRGRLHRAQAPPGRRQSRGHADAYRRRANRPDDHVPG